MSGIHPREKYSLENRRRLLGLPLARNPQDRPFSLLHSLFPIHQAFVTVIQIPIVIYVDINGNPSSCRCSSAILLHPSFSPYHRKDTLLAPTLPPPRPDIMLYWIRVVTVIVAFSPSFYPSLQPRITRFFDQFSFSFSFRLPDRLSWGGNQYRDLYEFY